MRVRALVEHRHDGETIEEGKSYELKDSLARRAIAEGFVEEVHPKKADEGKRK